MISNELEPEIKEINSNMNTNKQREDINQIESQTNNENKNEGDLKETDDIITAQNNGNINNNKTDIVEGAIVIPNIILINDNSDEINAELKLIAETGSSSKEWEILRKYIKDKINLIIGEYAKEGGQTNNNCQEDLNKIILTLNNLRRTPFTIQRISEILLDSKNIYKSTPKLLAVIKKLINIENC
jgi:hypothetical protein